MPLLQFKEEDKTEKKRLSLSLQATDQCTQQCTYCYERQSERNKGQMEADTAKNAITFYMERDDEFENVSIDFFGGEPFLAFSLIKEVIEWFFSRSWKKRAYFTIATNGTILTPEIKEWLAKYSKHLTLAFSLDGCKEVHDMNRCDSYDKVIENLPFFRKYWPYQSTKFTVNDRTIPLLAKNVLYMEELKLNFIGGIVLEDIWGDAERKKELLRIYEDQLATLVEFYSNRSDLFPPPPLFPVLPEYLGRPRSQIDQLNKETMRFCGAGHEMVTIDVDGTIAPCHRFLTLCTGKPIPTEPVNRQTRWQPEKCAQCQFQLLCPTCAGFNYQENGDTGIRTTYHCEAFKIGLRAACDVEALRLSRLSDSDIDRFSEEEKEAHRRRLDTVLNIIEEEN